MWLSTKAMSGNIPEVCLGRSFVFLSYYSHTTQDHGEAPMNPVEGSPMPSEQQAENKFPRATCYVHLRKRECGYCLGRRYYLSRIPLLTESQNLSPSRQGSPDRFQKSPRVFCVT